MMTKFVHKHPLYGAIDLLVVPSQKQLRLKQTSIQVLKLKLMSKGIRKRVRLPKGNQDTRIICCLLLSTAKRKLTTSNFNRYRTLTSLELGDCSSKRKWPAVPHSLGRLSLGSMRSKKQSLRMNLSPNQMTNLKP